MNNGIFDGIKYEFMGTIIKIIRNAELLIFIDPQGDLYLKNFYYCRSKTEEILM